MTPAPIPGPVFLWADASQNFVSSFDHQYQAVARSARSCTVYLSQNINNHYSVMGAQGCDESHALLGNSQTKIFHANGDYVTNEYAADRIAQAWTTTGSINTNTQGKGQGSHGSGFSESVQGIVVEPLLTLVLGLAFTVIGMSAIGIW